jgi:hypothetical protein
MSTAKPLFGAMVLLAAATAALAHWQVQDTPARGKFDKLTDADRQAFAVRFQSEIWPFLARNGKDGCVGCHTTKKGTLQFSGNADKDFQMLVGEGFLLKGDPGNLVERVAAKDKLRRMPPDDRRAWTEKEVQTIRAFIDDVDKKNQP